MKKIPNTPRYLITTADEKTWKFDRPVVFLGDWCCLYDRKHIWKEMDAIVAAPYGLGQTHKDADYAEARDLEERLFLILCDVLNQHYGAHHGARFWRIILGPWLRLYVNVMLNRVKTLEQCMQAHQLIGTTAYSDEHYSLATVDLKSALFASDDSYWNNALTVRILDLLGMSSCKVEVISSDNSEGFRLLQIVTEAPLKRRILRWGYRQVGNLAGLLARENDAFIINSYLPYKEKIKLELALGQVPQMRAIEKIKYTKRADRALRQNLSNQISGKSSDPLFEIMCSLVFELLPICYLEGSAEMYEKVLQLRWPSKPKFILTSNNFFTDEIFKIWTAHKVECGSKYITGQHGNNYGTNRYYNQNSIEEITADKFITWGWTEGLSQHTPAFILKTVGWKAGSYNSKGGLLLIELHGNHRITTWDRTHEFFAYYADQQTFVGNLERSVKKNLTIRMHSSSALSNWGEEKRWRDFDNTIKLEMGNSNIRKLIAQSRLIIHSYDSTGILETLSQNIPTLAFWQNDFDHLRESAKPYYQLLVDAGIVHLTPESVAKKVNEVWDDVDGWWTQNKVQASRVQFCDRYAKVSQYPVSELKQILLRQIS